MAFGGGVWTTQDKVLPGAYINFISTGSADARLSERGYASMPLELDWGPDGEIFEVTAEDFQNRSLSIFGYDYTHEKLKGLRDLFAYAKVLYAYRLNSGEKATCKFATAKCSGVRGNDLRVIIANSVDETGKFDVSGYLGTSKLSTQTVATAAELKDDEFFTWKKDATLEETAGTSLTGGTNGEITGDSYQTYLDKAESYSFNVMGIVTGDEKMKDLCGNYVKRMRDEIGVKFQLVMHNAPADFEGVINVKNATTDADWPEESAVYWATGASAGCAVNASNTNKKYDGEFTIACDYTQAQLVKAIRSGEFTFHRVGSEIRVLQDINSYVTFIDEKNELFADNQTIRVIDQIANDMAVTFNTRYLGTVANDAAGRISLWNDVCKLHQALEAIGAIEDFDPETVTVEQGNTKKSVVCTVRNLNIVNAMTQLYMSVIVA